MEASISMKGGKEIARELERMERRASQNLQKRAVRKSTNIFLKAVRKQAPHDTGILKRQTKTGVKFIRRDQETEGRVSVKSKKDPRTLRNPKQYQHLVVGGTQAHEIRGRLAFDDNVYSVIRHPGSKANPYVDRAFDANVPRVTQDITIQLRNEMLRK